MISCFEWEAFSWDNEGVPGGWKSSTPDGCQFYLITNPLELSISEAGQLVRLGGGTDIQELENLVASMYSERRLGQSEALAKALDCLQSGGAT